MRHFGGERSKSVLIIATKNTHVVMQELESQEVNSFFTKLHSQNAVINGGSSTMILGGTELDPSKKTNYSNQLNPSWQKNN